MTVRRWRCWIHLGHRWVRSVNAGWPFLRCTRCGHERELDTAFIVSLGRKPPPLLPPIT